MKKILIFIVVLLIAGVAGCQPKQTDPIVNESDVEEVMLLIELLPTEITESDRDFINQIKDTYALLSAEEKALVANYSVLQNAINIIAAIDAEKENAKNAAEQAVKNKLKAIVEDVAKDIPDHIIEDITLQVRAQHGELGTINIAWSSSDAVTLSSTGKYNPKYDAVPVTLTANVYVADVTKGLNVTYVYKKDVIVEPITMPELPEGRIVSVYSYGMGHGFDEAAVESLDIINHAFSSVRDGELVLLPDRWRQYEQLIKLRKEGIRIILCIDGYHDEGIGWSKAAKTMAGREKLAKSIVDTIVKYNYDGVDVDWEYPQFYSEGSGWDMRNNYQDTINYTLMMREIKRQLNAVNENYILSAAIPGSEFFHARYEFDKLANIFDYINMMTYDLDSEVLATHVSGLHVSSIGGTAWSKTTTSGAVDYFIQAGGEAIRSKLIIGGSFYGRHFVDTTGLGKAAKRSKDRNSSGSIPYYLIYQDYISKGHPELWDEQAKANYIVDAEKGWVFTYDSPRSIKEKTKYLLEEGLAGIMFWEYSNDPTGLLLKAAYEGINE